MRKIGCCINSMPKAMLTVILHRSGIRFKTTDGVKELRRKLLARRGR